jgi:phage FluMu gp28-like protein
MGVDLAKVQDYTVIAIYDRKTNSQVFQDRFNKLEWPYQKQKIIEISKHYNNAFVMLDASGIGDPIADDLLRASVPVEPIKLTNEMKKEIIEKLSIYIEQKHIHILNIEDTIREFNNFTYDISSTGKVMYNAPQGFNDDIVIAHALGVWSLYPIRPEVKAKPKTRIKAFYERQLTRYEDEGDIEEAW